MGNLRRNFTLKGNKKKTKFEKTWLSKYSFQ